MKRFIHVAVAIAAVACKTQTGSFTISGTVKNAVSDTLYLEQLSYISPETKKIDSVKISSGGKYTIKGSSDQQNLFVLGFKGNPAVILVNDGNDIKIDFDVNGFHYPEVSGSDATNELYAFIKDYWRRDSVLSMTYFQLDTIRGETLKDTAFINQIQQQYMRQLNDLSDLIRGYIGRSNNPAAICFALDKAKGVLSPQELTELVQNASKRFPQHNGITNFKTLLAAQQQGAETNDNYALLNQQAPDLTMPGTDGKNISISSFRGKYVLVDFWASWCGPCRQENPNVVAVYNKYKNKNFTILGVSLDNDKQAWFDAIKKDNLSWNHMSDLKQWQSSAVSAYQFQGIPFNVLIDPDGKIVAFGLRGPALDKKLGEVLR